MERLKEEADALRLLSVVPDAAEEEPSEWKDKHSFVREKAVWLISLIAELEESKLSREKSETGALQILTTDLTAIMAKLQAVQGMYSMERLQGDLALKDQID